MEADYVGQIFFYPSGLYKRDTAFSKTEEERKASSKDDRFNDEWKGINKELKDFVKNEITPGLPYRPIHGEDRIERWRKFRAENPKMDHRKFDDMFKAKEIARAEALYGQSPLFVRCNIETSGEKFPIVVLTSCQLSVHPDLDHSFWPTMMKQDAYVVEPDTLVEGIITNTKRIVIALILFC